jgi:hypothetical protein
MDDGGRAAARQVDQHRVRARRHGDASEVDFTNVSTIGLRANEARYFKNEYGQATTEPSPATARQRL